MTSPLQDEYLNAKKLETRLQILEKAKAEKQYFPLALVRDLFCLDLPVPEQVALIEAVHSKENIELEEFFTTTMATTHQDVGVACLYEWSERTEHRLWFRILEICHVASLPQRLRYCLLNVVSSSGGKMFLEAMSKMEELDEFSSAFKGKLLQQGVEWSFKCKKFKEIATNAINSLELDEQANEKGLPSAINYMSAFNVDELVELTKEKHFSDSWSPLIQSMIENAKLNKDSKNKIEKFFKATPELSKFSEIWPNLIQRKELSEEIIGAALHFLVESGEKNIARYFTGIETPKVVKAVCLIVKEDAFLKCIKGLESIVPNPLPQKLVKEIVQRLQKTENPQIFLETLSDRYRFELTQQNRTNDELSERIKEAEKSTINKVIKGKYKPLVKTSFEDLVESKAGDGHPDFKARQTFFDSAYRNLATTEIPEDPYWQTLLDTWKKPTLDKLKKLTPLARKAPSIYQICYIHTLGRFSGQNEAALKLLDFIRSDEEIEIKSVINSLAGINTPRAVQELVSAITRPNIDYSLQLEICSVLRTLDVSEVQGEIRSAIADIKPNKEVEADKWEIRESLEALLLADDSDRTSKTQTPSSGSDGFKELDNVLRDKIPHYDEMSSEVRRALRTAQFFYENANNTDSKSIIDLSPVIDMQYKALELTFREMFEDPCKQVVELGILQRKLDVMGYARPIEQQMNQFENFMSNLPVINSIPFFSRFKLRKMLRAICQFRPGKRFTLDGLKAFGLFFLCFGRTECRYGLQKIFPLSLGSDMELAEFTKKLHIFQDFRNRAAHEGFQPEAAKDMDEIWNNTAEIVKIAFKIKEGLAKFELASHASSAGDSAIKGYSKAEGFKVVHKKVS